MYLYTSKSYAMSLISILVALLIIGLVMYIIERYLPIDIDIVFKRLIYLVMIIVFLVWLLKVLGLIGMGTLKV